MVRVSVEIVGEAVVADVDHQIQVVSAMVSVILPFASPEPNREAFCLNQIGISFVSGKGEDVEFVLQFAGMTPFYQIIIYLAAELFTALERDDSQ